MKKTLFASFCLAAAGFAVSCAPLDSNAIRHNDGIPIYQPPGEWTSGGHFSGFAPSRPSANGYSAGGAPC